MKASKLRHKARSAFKRGPGRGRIKYRTDDGVVHDAKPEGVISVEIAVIRGRAFTRPQAAKQRHG